MTRKRRTETTFVCPLPHCLHPLLPYPTASGGHAFAGQVQAGDSPAAEAGTAAVAAAAEATTAFFVWQCVMYGRSLAILIWASRSVPIDRHLGPAFVPP